MMHAQTRTRGFTLLEMLVVIGIISILIALLLPTLTAARRNARNAATKATMHNLKIALENYRMDTGSFPIAPGFTGRIYDSGGGYTPPGYYGTSTGFQHPCPGVGVQAAGTETNQALTTVLINTRFLDVNKNNVVGGELKDNFNTPLLVRFLVLPPADALADKLTERLYIWSFGSDRKNDVGAAGTYTNLGLPIYDKTEADAIELTPAQGRDDITTWR